MFQSTGITVIVERGRYIGAAIGSESFIQNYVSDMIDAQVEDIEKLSHFTKYDPQAIYSAYAKGLSHKMGVPAENSP